MASAKSKKVSKPAAKPKKAAKAVKVAKPAKAVKPVKVKKVVKAAKPVKVEKAVKVVKVIKPVKVERPPIKHIAVAGNIGSGKTTLTEQLAKSFKWEPHYEDVENNPYLNDFYSDMPRWSFPLQVYFLHNRFRQIIQIQQGTGTVVQDRTIYEDATIFAPNLHAMGLMSSRDFDNYSHLFETINSLISPPDLLIYLRASIPTLVNQIQRRGREYEENLRLDYLRRLNEYYENWISKYDAGKLLIIDVDNCNFADDPEQLGEVVNKVNAELYGLF